MKITVLDNILQANDAIAAEIAAKLAAHRVFAINLMSSPGAGKTTLLERTLERLEPKGVRVGVIEGDIETSRDAERLEGFNVPVVQINTGTACHLDANMINGALANLDCSAIDLLFIENVGNLVCPSAFDLGETFKVALLSTTEGEDKPVKYPEMFRRAEYVVLNKIDLLPHIDFDVDRAIADGEESGFVDIESTPYLAGVGCEVCHGPGKTHVADPKPGNIIRKPPETTCRRCHTPARDDNFSYEDDIKKIACPPDDN